MPEADTAVPHSTNLSKRSSLLRAPRADFPCCSRQPRCPEVLRSGTRGTQVVCEKQQGARGTPPLTAPRDVRTLVVMETGRGGPPPFGSRAHAPTATATSRRERAERACAAGARRLRDRARSRLRATASAAGGRGGEGRAGGDAFPPGPLPARPRPRTSAGPGAAAGPPASPA